MVFTPIHQSLGLPPGELSIDLLHSAIQARVAETTHLDWKRSFYHPKDPKWDEEAAKDLAAMANSGGGWIVFGVGEDGSNNSAAELCPLEWDSSSQQRILNVAYAKVGPPVLGIDIYPIEHEDGNIVFIRVPDSSDAPHFARKSDGSFTAPRRNGPHTVFMSEREIERAFRERFQRSDDRENALKKIFDRAASVFNPVDGVCLVVAALPSEPSSAVAPDSSAMTKYIDSYIYPELLRENASIPRLHPGEIKKGMRQWVIRNELWDRHAYRKFLGDDGAVMANYRVGNLESEERFKAYYPVGEPNQCMTHHIESRLADFFTTLCEHAKDRRSYGSYTVRVGLMGNGAEPIFIRTTQGFGDYLLDLSNSEPIYLPENVTVDFNPLSSPTELLALLRGVALDLINQGGLRFLQVIRDEQ